MAYCGKTNSIICDSHETASHDDEPWDTNTFRGDGVAELSWVIACHSARKHLQLGKQSNFY